MSEDLLREPLAEPWTFGVTNDGRVFFINDDKKHTTWLHPDTGQPVRTGFRHRPDLPKGWEEGFTETGASYFINHHKGITTFTFPEKTDIKSKSSKKSKPPEERLYQNIDNETLRQERKLKRRNSSFLERAGINIFGRSRSKSRERPEQPNIIKKTSSKRMQEKRGRSEKKQKAPRPVSATSIRSNQSGMSFKSKMTASWRDPKKDIIKSGWLYKQDSTGKMKMWRKKWFVLSDLCLYYYKDSKEEEILGSIILPSYTVNTMTAEDRINRKYAFKVEHSGMRTYYLSADSYNDMALWIKELEKCCQPALPTSEKLKEADENEAPKIEPEENSKGTEGSKNKKKDSKAKPQEDDDSEFGFNHVRPAQSTSSHSTDQESRSEKVPPANLSSNNNKKKHEPDSHPRNGRLPSDSSRNPKHQEKSSEAISPSKAQELYQQSIPRELLKSSGKSDQHQRQSDRLQQKSHRQDPNPPHMRQHPHHKNARRENGESAYFSDTSGATDSSGRPSNAQRGQQPPNPQKNKVRRQDSLVKLGNWVSNQKMRQSGSALNSPQRVQPPINFDTASEFSSVSQQYTKKSATLSARGPPSSRRYRARTYNEYMDPMEVASSTISMPPLQHMNRMQRAHTLPRPQSTEEVDKLGRPISKSNHGQGMTTSKSAGNIVAVDQYGNPISPQQTLRGTNFDNSKRAKSEYVFPEGDDLQQQYLANFRKAQSKDNQAFRAPRQQHRSQPRPTSAGRSSNSSGGGLTPRRGHQTSAKSTPNDVFSPGTDRSTDPKSVFRFDAQNNLSPHGKASTLPQPQRTSDSSYEVKQVQRGQLRAFVVSSRSPHTQLPPPERQTPLKTSENIPRMASHITTERDVETKLKRLSESEQIFQQISDDVSKLLTDKENLEADLSIARSKQNRYSTGSKEVDTRQHKLEQELGNVRAQLANAVQKLKELNRENEGFDSEIRRWKASIVEELRNQRTPRDDVYYGVTNRDKEAKRKSEWELGRIEVIIDGLHKQRSLIRAKLEDISTNRDDVSPLLSPTSPPSMLLANGRSPRDIKRTSMERRTVQNRPSQSSTSSGGTPGSTPVKKYFTLPGRGVPHATSVDSVTAESLFKSNSPRPTSARSVSSIGSATGSLHRTKSASERLFNTQYNNQGSDHEAKEMKRLQKEILRNRRNNLRPSSAGDTSRRHSNPAGMTLPARSHMKVGIDVQMALKHHRMPKVLQRAKRDRAEAHMNQAGFDIDDLERQVNMVTGKQKPSGLYTTPSYVYSREDDIKMDSPDQEVAVEPEEITVDVNLTHQLIAPDKVEIPERYLEYENVELSPAEEKMKHKKVAAIERMLAKSGQPAALPAVHLAAALAVEAGSVARAVAMHASAPQRQPGDGQKENLNWERPVTDGSSSTGEEVDSETPPLPVMDPDYSQACII